MVFLTVLVVLVSICLAGMAVQAFLRNDRVAAFALITMIAWPVMFAMEMHKRERIEELAVEAIIELEHAVNDLKECRDYLKK